MLFHFPESIYRKIPSAAILLGTSSLVASGSSAGALAAALGAAAFADKKSGLSQRFVFILLIACSSALVATRADAIIITDGGVDVLRGLFAAGGAGGGAGTGQLVNNVVLVIRVVFWGLMVGAAIQSYEKWKDRSELIDVVMNPMVLLVVAGFVDVIATVFLRAPG